MKPPLNLSRAASPLDGVTYVPLWRRALAFVVPLGTVALALAFTGVPWVSVGWAFLVPDILAPVLFFWTVQQPRSVPMLLVFALGLMADVMDATPLGSQAAAYMVLVLVARTQAPALISLGLLFNWALFALVMLSFIAVKFLLAILGTPGVFQHSLVPALLQTLQLFLTTIMTYLPVHLVLGAVNRLIIGSQPN